MAEAGKCVYKVRDVAPFWCKKPTVKDSNLCAEHEALFLEQVELERKIAAQTRESNE